MLVSFGLSVGKLALVWSGVPKCMMRQYLRLECKFHRQHYYARNAIPANIITSESKFRRHQNSKVVKTIVYLGNKQPLDEVELTPPQITCLRSYF